MAASGLSAASVSRDIASALKRLVFGVPDYLFYVLTAALAGAMIFAAISRRGESVGVIVLDGVMTAEGEALAAMIAGPGTEVEFDVSENAAKASSEASFANLGEASAGVALPVPRDFERAVAGRRILVSAEVRAEDPSLRSMRLGYFTLSRDSGRLPFEISGEYQTISFTFDVPADVDVENGDWLGLWPDEDGLGRAVFVRRREVRILAGEDTAAE